MHCYIAGPMTGIAEYNYPAFERATQHLRSLGHQVTSPHEINKLPDAGEVCPPGSSIYAIYLRNDFKQLIDCDAIVLLAGWPTSTGARAELQIALALGMRVWFLHDDPIERVTLLIYMGRE